EPEEKMRGIVPPQGNIVIPAVRESASVEPAPLSIADRMKELARTQNVSGSWGSGSDEVEMTAAALLAFVRAGHTTRKGNYRRQLQKAVDFLAAAKASGFAAFARFRALSELADATAEAEDRTLADTARAALPAPSSDVERAALGEKIAAPAKIASMDDLRIAA